MKNIKSLAVLFAMALTVSAASAADIWVSVETGSKKGGDSQSNPIKNLQKAIDNAEEGDTIHIAEGVYTGNLNCGHYDIGDKNSHKGKAVNLIGGYSKDFSSRDVLAHQTILRSSYETSGALGSDALLNINLSDMKHTMVVDGLILDRGTSNGYHKVEGKPEGCQTGMLVIPPTTGTAIDGHDKTYTITTPLLRGEFSGNLTIQNCLFVNGANYAIQYGVRDGNMVIKNNVFVNNRMASCEVRGLTADPMLNNVEFCNNTVLFTWTRVKDLGDMGYAYRYMNGSNHIVHDNIFGFTTRVALDRGFKEHDKKVEDQKKNTSDNNVFIMNKIGDLSLPGSGTGLYVKAKDFDDVDELSSSDNNKELTDFSALKGCLNQAYLNGYLNLQYSETTDFDPNSAANQLRSAMGMNQVGRIDSKVSMFANYYPVEDALKVFGAMAGVGAQKP